ncbi:MAG: imidazoleglycerol-phosphate dehydratase HisB [Firmicutes bacterium]|nr:imidazoleglycerol-phosphate dehydratase HisB [Bacillota bacterium]
MKRSATIVRDTFETKIELSLLLDGEGKNNINTGIGFFDHMLTHISKHGFFDISIKAEGDTHVDAHHTTEDVGIVFGKALAQALGEKKGIKRYGHSIVPMDETLVLCAIDLSGRAYLNFDAEFTVPVLGNFELETVEEFFRAVSENSGMTLHIKVLEGKNNHHIAEGIFKAFGKALDMAVTQDERIKGVLSTKGMLE